jgi:hypothetical protein
MPDTVARVCNPSFLRGKDQENCGLSWVLVAQAYNPGYLRGWNQEDCDSRPTWAKRKQNPISKTGQPFIYHLLDALRILPSGKNQMLQQPVFILREMAHKLRLCPTPCLSLLHVLLKRVWVLRETPVCKPPLGWPQMQCLGSQTRSQSWEKGREGWGQGSGEDPVISTQTLRCQTVDVYLPKCGPKPVLSKNLQQADLQAQLLP